ncbi:MAG: aminotransferase class V-fold PLP-dependent enzyme [Salinivenus sp.]
MTESTLQGHTVRTHFPHTAHQTYLNHAAVSPVSRPVREAVDAYLDDRHGAAPEAPIENFDAVLPMMEEAKARAAAVLGTEAERIEFIPNTSMGLNILAQGLDWAPGDRIALPDGAFPTNVYPFLNLEREGVAVDFIPTEEGAYTVEDIERTLRPETRLLSVSWVHFLSGFRVDLEAVGELCAAHDVIFCVDAIQGLGALTLDVDAAGIDFLAAGGHKWLMGLQGAGLLYCDDALQDHIHPPTGWLHGPVDWEHLDRYDLDFHDDARRFRTGTLNVVGVVALHAALGLYLTAGPEWCETRVLDLSTTLADELAARGLPRYGTDDPAHASGIVTVVPDEPEALYEHLKDCGITAALRNRKVRFAPTYYNDETDLRQLLDAVDAFNS